jgi:membrane-associated protease RseP (regulator of RpoE activity)
VSGTVGVVAFVVCLIVMVMIHESGHYLTARLFGMKVEEFFFGFGPRIVSWRRGETEYGVKAIPAGGYVKIAGMNELAMVHDAPEGGSAAVASEGALASDGAVAVEAPDESRYFRSKPAWQRAIVLAAGSATHFILAGLLLTIMFAALGTIGNPTTTLDSVTASEAARSGTIGPAAKAGLKAGDTIVAADGVVIKSWDQLQTIIRDHPNVPVSLKVDRSGKTLNLTVTPESEANTDTSAGASPTVGFIGVSPLVQEHRQAIPSAVWSATKEVGTLVVDSVKSIGSIFSPSGFHHIFGAFSKGRNSTSSSSSSSSAQPVGLVGGARLAGQAVETGQGQPLLELLAAFIVFLGVLNLAPLPPLDGGHLIVLAIEKIRGHPVDARKVVPVAAFVLSVMIVLSVAILYLDIIHPLANPFQ